MSAKLRGRIARLERIVARFQHGHQERFDPISRLNAGRTYQPVEMTPEREAELRQRGQALRQLLGGRYRIEQARKRNK